MKRLICLLLLFGCVYQLNAQDKKKAAEELLKAREQCDSSFVEFTGGQRRAIKSFKNIQENGKVKIEFADGTKETYKIGEISCYQTDKYFSKRIDDSKMTPFSIPVLATRTERGAIECYSAFYETTVPNPAPKPGFRRDWVSCGLIEYQPGFYLIPYGDTTNLRLLGRKMVSVPAYVTRLNDLIASYSYNKYKKKPWEFMDQVYDLIRSYNKEVAEGRL